MFTAFTAIPRLSFFIYIGKYQIGANNEFWRPVVTPPTYVSIFTWILPFNQRVGAWLKINMCENTSIFFLGIGKAINNCKWQSDKAEWFSY
ncbi:hypothetical protein AWH63_19995 [Marinobacter sp. C18]|nr:hypothetical protein AWH63_19995 [Marinobacter sp. C18]